MFELESELDFRVLDSQLDYELDWDDAYEGYRRSNASYETLAYRHYA